MVDASGNPEPWEIGVIVVGLAGLLLVSVAGIFGTTCTEMIPKMQDGAMTLVELVSVVGVLLTLATVSWYILKRRAADRPRTVTFQWTIGGFGILLIALGLVIRPEITGQTAASCIDGLGWFEIPGL